MTSPFRDELAELDHLEPPEPSLGRNVSSGTGGTFNAHVWEPVPNSALERCERCNLVRFPFQLRNQGGAETAYRLPDGRLRGGAEPRCKRGRG